VDCRTRRLKLSTGRYERWERCAGRKKSAGSAVSPGSSTHRDRAGILCRIPRSVPLRRDLGRTDGPTLLGPPAPQSYLPRLPRSASCIRRERRAWISQPLKKTFGPHYSFALKNLISRGSSSQAAYNNHQPASSSPACLPYMCFSHTRESHLKHHGSGATQAAGAADGRCVDSFSRAHLR
jgi:hypothetical protein